MPYLNVKERTIEAKIVYYGAGLSGKTTNLEQIKKRTVDGRCGELMTLDTDGDRTLFFDWLPFNFGKFNGCDVKMQLYTVPGQAKYAETRKRVLTSADGVVLVLDSQASALERNRETLRDLRDHLKANNLHADTVPVVLQLNKRDLPTAMDPAEMLRELDLVGTPYVEAAAAKGEGVFETLKEVSQRVLQAVREQARERAPELRAGTNSGLDGNTLYGKLTGTAEATQVATTGVVSTGAVALAANGGGPTRAPVVSAAAPAERVVTAARTQPQVAIVGGPAKPASPPAAAPSAAPGPAPSGAQLSELVVGQRNLARRLEQLESVFATQLDKAALASERRLVAQLKDQDPRPMADLTQKLSDLSKRLDQVTQHVTTLVNERMGEINTNVGKSTQSLDAAIGRVAAYQNSTSTASRDQGKRLDEIAQSIKSLSEALAEVRATSDAAEGKVRAACDTVAGRVERALEARASSEASARRDTHTSQMDMLQRMAESLGAVSTNLNAFIEESKKQKSWWR
jgi:hypothetical protein